MSMGVYINGMELPKSCADCPICYDQMECPISDLRFWRGRPENKEFKFTEERHPRCQLTDENEMRIYWYPAVHGEWIVDSIADNIFRCSICGQDAPVEPTGGTEYKSNFCPNCGAKMDGGKEDE